MKKVSIVIPAYNCEEFIEETIKSVLLQIYENFELIIVDDGSTDNTGTLVKKYLKDERIKYIYQENKGVSVARNKGYGESEGEYICFLDADDIWYPNKLEKQVEILNKFEDVGIVSSLFHIIDKDSKVIDSPAIIETENPLELLIRGQNVIGNPSAVMLRRCCLEKLGLFDPELSVSADIDMWIRVLLHYKHEVIREVLIGYRKSPDSMVTNTLKYETDMVKVLDKYCKLNPEISLRKKNKLYSSLYYMFSKTYFKKVLSKNFINTAVLALKYYAKSII